VTVNRLTAFPSPSVDEFSFGKYSLDRFIELVSWLQFGEDILCEWTVRVEERTNVGKVISQQ
jgi:hypothetical protein